MTVFIGISGPIAAGKSTLAKGLAQILGLYGRSAQIIPFAYGLKYLAGLYDSPYMYRIAYDYFRTLGYNHDVSLCGVQKLIEAFLLFPIDDTDKKPRRLYQFIGTELGRDTIDPNIWVNALHKRYLEHYPTAQFILIDDLRFPNECDFINVHIQLHADTDSAKNILAARYSQLPPEYTYTNHKSEQTQLSLPDYRLPVDYTVLDVLSIAEQLHVDFPVL